MASQDITTSPEEQDKLYKRVFWRTFGFRTKGLLGGAVTGLLCGALIGAPVGAALGVAGVIGGGAIAAAGIGAAIVGAAGVMLGTTIYTEVASTAGAVTSALIENERMHNPSAAVQQAKAPDQPETEEKTRLFHPRTALIGALCAMAIGGVIIAASVASGGALPVLGLGATGTAGILAAVAGFGLMGASFGLDKGIFSRLLSSTDKVVEGDLGAARDLLVKPVRQHGSLAEHTSQPDKHHHHSTQISAQENVISADFQNKLLQERAAQAASTGRGA